jgi:hypothetical protein
MPAAALLLGLWLAASASAIAAPDFDALLDQIDRSLVEAGRGGTPGERIELDRFSADGWELRLSAAWDGTVWRLLALRLNHPEWTRGPDRRWLERYRQLLSSLHADDLEHLETPDLFEVPPPDFLPAWPGELRVRQFEIESFWYQASWINEGGPDDYARWSLRSFELVAQPASDR